MSKSEGNDPVITTDDIESLLKVMNGYTTKSAREAALRRIREIERRDGIEIYGSYNGG